MTRTPVDSSSIASIGYCKLRNALQLEFVHGGIYEYLDVPEEEHQALMSAPSKGQRVNSAIKSRFLFSRVGSR